VWIRRRLRETRVKVAIGVGGLFDVCAGNLTRPPLWIREICMEWAYRLCHEPARLWRRYLIGNAVFLARALAHKMGFVRRRSKIAAPSAIHANPAHLAGCESRAA
jgi:UDP-N-acetyl-D-mannosaminuronic acid transferase (WecB/TagA/CpsF family)